jgi:cytochrome c-type protein NapC
MLNMLKKIWNIVKSPSVHLSLGFLTLGGFAAGVFFWIGFNASLEATDQESFCIGCHGMTNNIQELQSTIHFSNRTGVRAKCGDCHEPHGWTNMIVRKIQASEEVLGSIFGVIDTPEKYEQKRRELAERVWGVMQANDSADCRYCHDFESMDFTRQSKMASDMHSTLLASGEKTCIDCHKGIAHHLPDMAGVEGF